MKTIKYVDFEKALLEVYQSSWKFGKAEGYSYFRDGVSFALEEMKKRFVDDD